MRFLSIALSLTAGLVSSCDQDSSVSCDGGNCAADSGYQDGMVGNEEFFLGQDDQGLTDDQGVTLDQQEEAATSDSQNENEPTDFGNEQETAKPPCNQDLIPSDLGPVESCAQVSAKDCWASSECEADERCENIGDKFEVPCCVPGLRGCKSAGELCDSELECDEGLCISKNDSTYRCSKLCDGPEDCPEPVIQCHSVLGMCVEP